jgi:hypothetical protein
VSRAVFQHFRLSPHITDYNAKLAGVWSAYGVFVGRMFSFGIFFSR